MSVRAENLNLERCEATGKLKFRSRAKAQVHCNRTARSNKQHGDRHPVHVYACEHCSGHHVGHDSTFKSRNGKYGELKRK